eukprot:jgi/Tetstr1/439647/TSEL_028068.t1
MRSGEMAWTAGLLLLALRGPALKTRCSARGASSSPSSAAARASRASPLRRRAELAETCPQLRFSVVGVSFEGRQEAVAALEAAQGVALVKEPENPHDPHAVRVQTLGGRQLGYIPRDATHEILHDVSFGHVVSAGQNAKGLYGASIALRPALPPLTLELFPPSLGVAAANLSHYAAAASCEALREATCAAAGHRCAITGGEGTQVSELWEWDAHAGCIRLQGLACVHPEVAMVKRLPQLRHQEYTAALKLLRGVNKWSDQDCHDYLEYTAMRHMQMYSAGDWTVDCSWLDATGVQTI